MNIWWKATSKSRNSLALIPEKILSSCLSPNSARKCLMVWKENWNGILDSGRSIACGISWSCLGIPIGNIAVRTVVWRRDEGISSSSWLSLSSLLWTLLFLSISLSSTLHCFYHTWLTHKILRRHTRCCRALESCFRGDILYTIVSLRARHSPPLSTLIYSNSPCSHNFPHEVHTLPRLATTYSEQTTNNCTSQTIKHLQYGNSQRIIVITARVRLCVGLIVSTNTSSRHFDQSTPKILECYSQRAQPHGNPPLVQNLIA